MSACYLSTELTVTPVVTSLRLPDALTLAASVALSGVAPALRL